MGAFFLYHRTTRPTGQVLVQALGIPHGTEPPAERLDLLIRWGSQARTAYQARVVMNPANAIARATDKLGSLERMRDRGVVVPNYSTNPRELTAPFLGRAREHTRGQDIVLCLQQRDAGNCDYYIEYIPVAREYRVRVVGDECVRISEKVLRNREDYVPWIRNYETGHVFVSPQSRLNRFQETLAVSAVQAHGLHFGAVDMVIGDDGVSYVLEVNTAPALAPRSAGAMLGGMVRFAAEHDVELEPDYDVLDLLSPTDDGDGDTEDDYDDTTF